MHATRCPLIGDVEDAAAERPGGLEVEHDRQRHRVERPDDHVVRHGAAERHVLRRTVVGGRDEPGQGIRRQMRLELVGERSQAGCQAGGLGGRRRRADRQSDQAAQDVSEVTRLVLAVPEPGVVLE